MNGDLTPKSGSATYARLRGGNYDIIVALFCGILIISNISATKLIQFGDFDLGWFGQGIVTDGGGLLFPLAYVLGDVLSEVYGLKAARRAIITGFALSILASLSFWLVIQAPAIDPAVQSSFEMILGFVPRIVLASMAGYLVGQFLNAFVLVKMKERAGEQKLWARLVGSTVVGEFFDTMIFCLVAFGGTIDTATMINYIIVGYLYKCLVEFVFLPVTYLVIGAIKRREPEYRT
ncbi:queuosine precursor transporter [Micrococcales bacterium 31B]|nr:queuosine precursor transporter [Micrococcales bacterium 31B]